MSEGNRNDNNVHNNNFVNKQISVQLLSFSLNDPSANSSAIRKLNGFAALHDHLWQEEIGI